MPAKTVGTGRHLDPALVVTVSGLNGQEANVLVAPLESRHAIEEVTLVVRLVATVQFVRAQHLTSGCPVLHVMAHRDRDPSAGILRVIFLLVSRQLLWPGVE